MKMLIDVQKLETARE